MIFGILPWLLVAAGGSVAERWRWPEEPRAAASVRIDTKVSFDDDSETSDRKYNQGGSQNVQSDELPFQPATNTAGFYNRPPGEGRYPMLAEPPRGDRRGHSEQYRARPGQSYPVNIGGQNKLGNYISDGTLDSLQYCKCVTTPNCRPVADKMRSCGPNEYLCCYNAPNSQQNSEFFNEIDDERPALLPSYTNIEGPFPPPPGGVNGRPNDGKRPTGNHNNQVLVGPGGPTGSIGPGQNTNILVGPDGPTGVIGPGQNTNVLVGPDGPTGVIGPGQNTNILVGPEGPTGIIGPANTNRNPGNFGGPNGLEQSESAQRGVLIGPGGPTGIIGPQYNRPVLVGPGGPTGIIGPRQRGYGSRGVLVGPGGPTGIVGPAGFNQRRNPGVLVGPGGPTGIIGPGRQVLVGPGGPTGQIGPRGPVFGK